MAQLLSVLLKLHYTCCCEKLNQPYLSVFLNLEVIITTNMRTGFNDLESNDREKVEEFKLKLREQFNATKDPWILNGMYDYYMATNSTRALDVLVTVREPHDKFLFDRLCDGIKSKDKMPALLLLGSIVRRIPIWLYKISQHSLLKELIRLLRIETNTVIIVSALLVLNILLPLIPALIGPYLPDIFEIFSRFAAWNTNNRNKLPDGHLLHLQIALYTLFHRLYGMFPYNFLSYLRQEYSLVDHMPIFNHTIKPMLSTVKVNPMLITNTSKEFETSIARWKKLEHHDIIFQCAQLLTGDSVNDASNNAVETKETEVDFDKLLNALKTNDSGTMENDGSQSDVSGRSNELWSPTVYFKTEQNVSAPTCIQYHSNVQSNKPSSPYVYQHGISPPETGIEATPETTPVRMEYPSAIPEKSVTTSSAKRILINVIGFGSKTSTSPVPQSSSEQHNASTFQFPSIPNSFQHSDHKIEVMLRERNEIRQANEAVGENKQSKISSDPSTTQSSSVLTMISATTSKSFPANVPHRFTNTEDKKSHSQNTGNGQVVLVENGGTANKGREIVMQQLPPVIVANESSESFECCEQDQIGSPCSSGGLHMPDTRSMLEFANQVHRLRYYSQCNSDISSTHTLHDSSSNSSSNGSPDGTETYIGGKVRRAKSCPNINRGNEKPDISQVFFSRRPKNKKLVQTNGTSSFSARPKSSKNGFPKSKVTNIKNILGKKEIVIENNSTSTQTDESVAFQYPYEHLFLSLFPQQLGPPESAYNDNKRIFSNDNEDSKFWRCMYSPSSLLHRYIESVLKCDSKEVIAKTKLPFRGNILQPVDIRYFHEQVLLLSIQLQFEEYRREVHAERNRRLLGRSRNIKALEEHNSALRDQIGLLQKDLENAEADLSRCRTQFNVEKDRLNKIIADGRNQNLDLQFTIKHLRNRCRILEQELREEQRKGANTTKSLYETQAALLDTGNELKCTRQEATSCRKYKSQVHFLQREVLKAGEMIIQYRNTIRELGRLNCSDIEFDMYKQMFTKQVYQLQGNLHSKMVEISALKSHCYTLQADVKRKKQLLEEQKLNIDKLNEKYKIDMKTWKEKYDAMKASYNREVESGHDLQHKLAIARAVHKRYPFHHMNHKLPPDEIRTVATLSSISLSTDGDSDSRRHSSSHDIFSQQQQQQSLSTTTKISSTTRHNDATSSSVVVVSDAVEMSVDEIKSWLHSTTAAGNLLSPPKQAADLIDPNINASNNSSRNSGGSSSNNSTASSNSRRPSPADAADPPRTDADSR